MKKPLNLISDSLKVYLRPYCISCFPDEQIITAQSNTGGQSPWTHIKGATTKLQMLFKSNLKLVSHCLSHLLYSTGSSLKDCQVCKKNPRKQKTHFVNDVSKICFITVDWFTNALFSEYLHHQLFHYKTAFTCSTVCQP